MSARHSAALELGSPVQATPGWYVLTALRDDSGYPVEAHQEPVIAWCFDTEFSIPYPVTEDGAQTDQLLLLRPDGSVSRTSSEWFPSVTAWLEHEQQAHLARASKADHS